MMKEDNIDWHDDALRSERVRLEQDDAYFEKWCLHVHDWYEPERHIWGDENGWGYI